MDNQNPVPNPEEQANKQTTPPFSDASSASQNDDMMKTSIGAPTPMQSPSPDPMRTMLDANPSATPDASTPPASSSTPPSPPSQSPSGYDPFATQYVGKDAPPAVNYDPYATQFDPLSKAETDAAIAAAAEKRKTQEQQATKASGDGTGKRRLPSMPAMNFQLSGTSLVSELGLLPLTGIYALIILVSSLGMAFFMRFLGMLLLYGDIAVVRTLLGLVGAGLAVGLLAALKYVPQLAGLQPRFDSLDLQRKPIEQPSSTPKANLDFWFFVFAGALVALSLVLGFVSTEQLPIVHIDGDDVNVERTEESLDEGFQETVFKDIDPVRGKLENELLTIEVKQIARTVSALFGLLGALAIAATAFLPTGTPEGSDASARPFTPLQIGVALMGGLGLLMWTWSLKLISHQSGDFIYFVLLAFVGMYVMAGQHLAVLPARFLAWVRRWRMGIYVVISSVLLMSLVTIFFDAKSVRGTSFSDLSEFNFTWRFAFSPAYFIFTIADHGIILMLVISIVLVAFGLLGTFLALQAFGQEIVEKRQTSIRIAAIVATTLVWLLIPMILTYGLLEILGADRIIEAILLVLLPFAYLMGALWVLHHRTALFDRVMGAFDGIVKRLPQQLPPFLRLPLQQVTAVRGDDVKAFIPWPLGIALAMGVSLIAAPFVLSFWFYLIVLVGLLFLLSDHQPRAPKPIVATPTPPSASPSEPSTTPDPSVSPTNQPAQEFRPPTSPFDSSQE